MATEADSGSTLQQENQEVEEATKKLESMNVSFRIWPPSQRTRDAVTKRLVETLSATSILSKRYGAIPPDEATGVAERIEDEAFTDASASPSPSPVAADDDGIEILQAYSKEISKRVLDYMKSRSASREDGGVAATTVDSAALDEESSTVETEA